MASEPRSARYPLLIHVPLGLYGVAGAPSPDSQYLLARKALPAKVRDAIGLDAEVLPLRGGPYNYDSDAGASETWFVATFGVFFSNVTRSELERYRDALADHLTDAVLVDRHSEIEMPVLVELAEYDQLLALQREVATALSPEQAATVATEQQQQQQQAPPASEGDAFDLF